MRILCPICRNSRTCENCSAVSELWFVEMQNGWWWHFGGISSWSECTWNNSKMCLPFCRKRTFDVFESITLQNNRRNICIIVCSRTTFLLSLNFFTSFGVSKGGVAKICDRFVDAILIALNDCLPVITDRYLQQSKTCLEQDGKSHVNSIFALDGKHVSKFF